MRVAKHLRFFPREHGAIVVLAASWAVGATRSVIAGQSLPASWTVLSAISIFALFLTQEPIKAFIRVTGNNSLLDERHVSRLFGSLSVGLASFALLARAVPAIMFMVPLSVLPIAAIAYTQTRRSSLFVKTLAGFSLLTLAGPIMLLLARGALASALSCWLELLLFFWDAAFLVNIRIDPKAFAWTRRYFILLIPTLLPLFAVHLVTITGLVVLSLSAARALWVLSHISSYRNLSLKAIGMQEAIASLLLIAMQVLIV